MTVIVGCIHRGRAWMGGDSIVSSESGWRSNLHHPKVFKLGPYVFGVCGDLRFMNVVYDAFTPPMPPKQYVDRFMITAMIPQLRKCVMDTGAKDDGASGDLMIGHAGKLWVVLGDDWSMYRVTGGCEAIGSGARYALGVMEACRKDAPQDRIRKAIKAASALDWSVGGKACVLAV